MNDVKFNDKLRCMLDYFGMSQNAFAAKANLNRVMINNYLNGSQPTYETLSNLLNAFPQISAEWLMRGEGSMLKENTPKEMTYAQSYSESVRNVDSIIADSSSIELLSRPIAPHEYEEIAQKAKNLAKQLSWVMDRYVSMENRYNQMQEAFIASTTNKA